VETATLTAFANRHSLSLSLSPPSLPASPSSPPFADLFNALSDFQTYLSASPQAIAGERVREALRENEAALASAAALQEEAASLSLSLQRLLLSLSLSLAVIF
jgi:hypothetical protein